MLRSRFEAVPGAFCGRLVPSANKESKKKEQVIPAFKNLEKFAMCSS